MSYSQIVPLEVTSLVDISASDQTLPFITPFAMRVFGCYAQTTEAWGTIDTGEIQLSIGGSDVSTITPVTSGAVGTCYAGTDMNPVYIAAGGTINVTTTQDASQAGTAKVFILVDMDPQSAPA